VITNVESAAMMAAIADVVSNVAHTAGAVNGGAPMIMAPPPAGADEASALATVNTSAHSAHFLSTAAQGFLHMAHYAGTLGVADASYEITDGANGMQFL
jgi:hypothetical protein